MPVITFTGSEIRGMKNDPRFKQWALSSLKGISVD